MFLFWKLHKKTQGAVTYTYRPLRGIWWVGCVLGAWLAGGAGGAIFAFLAGLDITWETHR